MHTRTYIHGHIQHVVLHMVGTLTFLEAAVSSICRMVVLGEEPKCIIALISEVRYS